MSKPIHWAAMLLCLPLGLYAHSPFQLTENSSSFSIQVLKKLIFVEASVDGQQGIFLFDTGISELTLNYDNFVHYRMEQGDPVTDINGESEHTRRVFVTNFIWGDLKREQFKVQTMDLSEIAEIVGQPVLGIIGHQVIRELEVLVDYDKRRMVLSKLDRTGMPLGKVWAEPDHTLAFEMQKHLPVFEISFEGGEVMQVGLDSGASMNVVDRRFRRDAKGLALRLFHIKYKGALSTNKVPYYTMPHVEVEGQLSLIHCKLAFPSLAHFPRNDVYIDGLLGIDLFRLGRVAINYKQKTMKIWVNDNLFALKYKNLTQPLVLVNSKGTAEKGKNYLASPKSPEER